MRRLGTWLLGAVALLAVALYFMPLRLAVDMAGLDNSRFSAQDISGSIWDGRIEGAQIGPFALGDLDAGVQFLPLLTGNIKLDLARDATPVDRGLSATIGKQGDGLTVENATTVLNVGSQLAPLPASLLELDGVNVAFAGGQCRSASGKVRLSLDANIPGLALKQGLLGNVACEQGALVLPLSSGSAMEQLTLTLQGDGSYGARLFLSGNQRAWALILPSLGFRRVPNGYALRITGQLGQQ